MQMLLTGTDILNGKGILTKRKDEHELLMSIRNGEVSFEEIWRLTDEYQSIFDTAAKNTKLPDEPNWSGIDRLLKKIYRERLKEGTYDLCDE